VTPGPDRLVGLQEAHNGRGTARRAVRWNFVKFCANDAKRSLVSLMSACCNSQFLFGYLHSLLHVSDKMLSYRNKLNSTQLYCDILAAEQLNNW